MTVKLLSFLERVLWRWGLISAVHPSRVVSTHNSSFPGSSPASWPPARFLLLRVENEPGYDGGSHVERWLILMDDGNVTRLMMHPNAYDTLSGTGRAEYNTIVHFRI